MVAMFGASGSANISLGLAVVAGNAGRDRAGNRLRHARRRARSQNRKHTHHHDHARDRRGVLSHQSEFGSVSTATPASTPLDNTVFFSFFFFFFFWGGGGGGGVLHLLSNRTYCCARHPRRECGPSTACAKPLRRPRSPARRRARRARRHPEAEALILSLREGATEFADLAAARAAKTPASSSQPTASASAPAITRYCPGIGRRSSRYGGF